VTVPALRAPLLAVGAAAVAVAGVALAANAASFTDPAGDSGGAPDVTAVAISSSDNGRVTVSITAGGRASLTTQDQVGFVLDVDQNPDTGSVLYGSEIAVVLEGPVVKVYRAGPSGFLTEDAPVPGSLQGSFSGGVATFSFAPGDLGIAPGGGFNLAVTSFGENGTDIAPNIRTVNYQLVSGTQAPSLGPDRRAPVDEAVTTLAKRGTTVHLDYSASDGRGETADTLRVFHGKRVVKTVRYALDDTNPFLYYFARWSVPRKARGPYRFCVSSVDRAGNRSKVACAKITLR
jgi:hypothetical protein